MKLKKPLIDGENHKGHMVMPVRFQEEPLGVRGVQSGFILTHLYCFECQEIIPINMDAYRG